MSALLLAQDKPQYAVSLIPDSLKKEVNSIIREQKEVLEVKRPGRGRQEVKRVVTILNDKADRELVFVEYPDQFRKIDDVEINVYDEKGNYIRKYKRKDLEKVSTDDGMSLITDNKILYTVVTADKYPLTVEYNYTITYEGFFDYDDFLPQVPSQSIQQSSFSITAEASNKVRYKNYRCDLKPDIKEANGLITYQWTVRNTGPYQLEAGSASRDIPRVQIAPSLFDMDNYSGDMSTWENFGKWQATLISQTNRLSNDKIGYYRNLVKDAASEREKVAILYKHLQENYRYVSIQLGIGGWKPFSADFTESKKYGDCKALSNFMQAMLEAVGIRSHYAVINAGYDQIPADINFPQNTFNHVILCVPQPKDTIWLECTSRTQPFGVLGNFTENRNAFLITERGGVMVPTPRSNPNSNTMSTHTLIEMDENGSGKASIDIRHQGEFTDIINARLLETTDQNKKDYLINRKGYKQADVITISKKEEKGRNFVLHMDMEFEKIPDFGTGSKYFMNPRLYKFWNMALPKMETRKNDYYMEFPFIQSDTTVYQFPSGFSIETLPPASQIQSPLARFSSSYQFDAAKNQLITICRIQIDKHIIPAPQYQEMAKFFSDVIREQQQKIVIKKPS